MSNVQRDSMMDDDSLLAILANERKNSIGFDHDDALASERETALNYSKGVMTDIPALPNRSKAVATVVSDAIETILPDLVDIFTGEDVATFAPKGPEDEEGAQQETDYIQHVFFEQNPGFMVLYAMFKDACQSKTGVGRWRWEEPQYGETEIFESRTAMEAQELQQYGEIVNVTPQMVEPGNAPLFTIELRQVIRYGCVKVEAFPPEDFTVGADTVRLADATYCALRTRQRAQDLILDGVDEDIVESLEPYTSTDEGIELARDTVDESDEQVEGFGSLRMVEVVEHYIRLKGKLWRVLTGNDEKVLIQKEEVEEIQVAAITPYVVTHRFYGESVADKLLEIQRIQTTLTRMALDSAYFALNQRMAVDMTKANEFTLTDLLRNEPMMPIRMGSAGAVTPIQSPGLSFDAFGALEYFETMAEKRTGIVRNAQGLNPDTLHDTAKGMAQLVSASQKRVRLIARIFAETGVKDMFLGIHALIRRNVSQAQKFRLNGKWIDTDPTKWGNRDDMTIEIGLGSSGREAELQAMAMLTDTMEKLITLQGGAQGPVVDMKNVYALAARQAQKLGFKAPELFFTDPSQQPQQPEGVDPAQAQAQAEMQMEQAKLAAQVAADQAKAEADLAIQREKAAGELAIKREEMELKMQLEREKAQLEASLRRDQFEYEARLNAQANALKAQDPQTSIGPVRDGGQVG